jgi:hypothetical protein
MCITLQVNLGVLLHNENTVEGIAAIMTEMHKYVPGSSSNSRMVPVISGGDLLTCEREANVQEDRRESSAEERWGGMVPNIDDFHTTANFYKVRRSEPLKAYCFIVKIQGL